MDQREPTLGGAVRGNNWPGHLDGKQVIAIGLDTHLYDYPWVQGVRCEEFPGSCFFLRVRLLLEKAGLEVRLGQDVLREIQERKLSVNNVHLLQFEDSATGHRLLGAGANPSLLVNLESPLFMTDLYLDLAKFARISYRCLGVWSPSPSENLSGNMISARFPSYSDEDRLTRSSGKPLFGGVKSFQDKRLASMIVSDKFWRQIGVRHMPRNLTKSILIGSRVNKRHQLRRQSLHDTRLRLISFFRRRQLADIWGTGWDGRKLPFPFNFDLALRSFRADSLPFGGREKLKVMSDAKNLERVGSGKYMDCSGALEWVWRMNKSAVNPRIRLSRSNRDRSGVLS